MRQLQQALVILFCTLLLAVSGASAQRPLYSASELDTLLRPIALYPDPLLAQMLPAAAYPSEVEAAAQWLRYNPGAAYLDSQPWDASVKALVRYPSVLNMMAQDLAWTSAVGYAFANQMTDVVNSIQRLRHLAYANSNLVTTPEQVVTLDDNFISIDPATPYYVYVPTYDYWWVYGPRPIGWAYPGLTFGIGYPCGPWLTLGIDWWGGCCFHYPHNCYWGPGGNVFEPGNVYNVHNVHERFNSTNGTIWQRDNARFTHSQISPSRLQRLRLNDFRGQRPLPNDHLPQLHGPQNTLQNAHPALPGYTPGSPSMSRPSNSFPGMPNASPGSIPSVRNGPTTTFEGIRREPDITTIQRRGSDSLNSRPSPTFSQPTGHSGSNSWGGHSGGGGSWGGGHSGGGGGHAGGGHR